MAITYADKELNEASPLPEEKKWTFGNANEVKNVVNQLVTDVGLKADTTYVDTQDAATLAAANAHSDALVVGLWDDRGNFSAAGGAYPSSGGSGTAGAILKGDIWTISVAGTLPTGQVVEIGDTVRALVDTPGNVQADWSIQQTNIGYVPQQQNAALTQISGLSPVDDDILQRKAGAWVNRTMAQLNADLGALEAYTNHVVTFVGLNSSPTPVYTARFYRVPGGKTCHFYINLTVAVSNAANFQLNLPFAAANTGRQGHVSYVTNNGTPTTGGFCLTTANSTTLDIFRDGAGTGFTSSGSKLLIVSITYETV